MSSKKKLIPKKKTALISEKKYRNMDPPPPLNPPKKKYRRFLHPLNAALSSHQTQGTVNSTCGWSELGSTLALLQQSTCLSDQFRPQILGGMKGG